MTRAVVVGAGHNGLVAATLLARAGLDVTVVEAAGSIGGACRTETPFPRVPGLRQSTGAYLLGLMPPELVRLLDLDLPLLRRDPHYFLPTRSGRYLLAGSGGVSGSLLTDADRAADARLAAELAALREDLAPAWLAEPLPLAETADRYVRRELRDSFLGLCRGSVVDYLQRFGFETELVLAMYAATDGLTGLHGGPDSPGSGHNFLVHNMCRLPGADGTWMIVRGGMGTVTTRLAEAAVAAGARLLTGRAADVELSGGAVAAVHVGEDVLPADLVVACCDPFRLTELVPRVAGVPPHRTGTTLKVNLALRDLPRFSCLPADAPSPFGATVHLLPEEQPLAALRAMWADVEAGRLPERPVVEWYVHTTVDPSLQDAAGHHSAALFVQSVPHDADWDRRLDGYVLDLLRICDEYAPGTSAAVADVFALAPPDIERHFGITGGHIFHVDNALAFTDRMPYRTGVPGLYAGGAGCHPAGSVIGAAGHNAASAVLADLAV